MQMWLQLLVSVIVRGWHSENSAICLVAGAGRIFLSFGHSHCDQGHMKVMNLMSKS